MSVFSQNYGQNQYRIVYILMSGMKRGGVEVVRLGSDDRVSPTFVYELLSVAGEGVQK